MYGSSEFTVAGVFRRTSDTIRRHAGILVALSFVLYALPATLLGLLARFGTLPGVLSTTAASGEPLTTSGTGILIGYGLVSVIVLIVGSLLSTAAVIWVSCQTLTGRPARFSDGVTRAFRVLPGTLAMTILMGLALLVAFLLLVVPGVMLMLRWIAAIPALVVERAGVLGSLGRSRDLTRGHRWAILGFLLVLGLVVFIVFAVVAIGGAFAATMLLPTSGPTVAQIITLASNAILSAVNGAAVAALYIELRRSGEGGLSVETAEAFA